MENGRRWWEWERIKCRLEGEKAFLCVALIRSWSERRSRRWPKQKGLVQKRQSAPLVFPKSSRCNDCKLVDRIRGSWWNIPDINILYLAGLGGCPNIYFQNIQISAFLFRKKLQNATFSFLHRHKNVNLSRLDSNRLKKEKERKIVSHTHMDIPLKQYILTLESGPILLTISSLHNMQHLEFNFCS